MSNIETMISRLTNRQCHEFALSCARRVQHLMTDPRSVAALDTRERWLRGEATDAKMAAERAAAWDAARAAWAAAWAAEAAERAADAAAWDAPASASTAAWTAERAWQRDELERMLGGGA